MVMMDMVIMAMAVFWILVLAAVAKADAEAHPCLAGWQGGPVDCSGARLVGVDLEGAYLPDSRFDGAYLARSSFRGAYLSGSTFDGALLHKIDLQGARASGVSMRFATVVESSLGHAKLDYADLTGVSIVGCEGLDTASSVEAEMTGSHGLLAGLKRTTKLQNMVHLPLIPPAVESTLFLSPAARKVIWAAFTALVVAALGAAAIPLAFRKAATGEAPVEATAEDVAEVRTAPKPKYVDDEEEEEVDVTVRASQPVAFHGKGKENFVFSPGSDQSEFSTMPTLQPKLKPILRRRTALAPRSTNIMTDCSPNKKTF